MKGRFPHSYPHHHLVPHQNLFTQSIAGALAFYGRLILFLDMSMSRTKMKRNLLEFTPIIHDCLYVSIVTLEECDIN
jgi:hypothetical protein